MRFLNQAVGGFVMLLALGGLAVATLHVQGEEPASAPKLLARDVACGGSDAATSGPVVKGVEAGVGYTAFYFDPVRGRRFDLGPVSAPGGEYRAPRLPSPQDWVLVLERD